METSLLVLYSFLIRAYKIFVNFSSTSRTRAYVLFLGLVPLTAWFQSRRKRSPRLPWNRSEHNLRAACLRFRVGK